MLSYLLDTNVCIMAMRNPGDHVAARFKANAGTMCISTITLHELRFGADKSNRPAHQHEKVDDLVSRLEVLKFDDDAADQTGEINASLARKGQIIGAYDMLIAGHARSRGLTVVTNNLKEFTRVDGLRCEDWL